MSPSYLSHKEHKNAKISLDIMLLDLFNKIVIRFRDITVLGKNNYIFLKLLVLVCVVGF